MSTCSRCGAAFACGMVDAKDSAPCWCTALPVLPPSAYRSESACVCPNCLRELIDAATATTTAEKPQV